MKLVLSRKATARLLKIQCMTLESPSNRRFPFFSAIINSMNGEVFKEQDSINNPWESLANYQSPRRSADQTCNFTLRIIEDEGKMNDILGFVDEKSKLTPKVYQSVEEFYDANPGYKETLASTLSQDEKDVLRDYTIVGFTAINSTARGIWDYEKLGKLTPEIRANNEEKLEKISGAIKRSPAVAEDFLTFRGTNLDGFRTYGIHELSELKKLEGQFYLDQSPTSTALIRERGFADRKEASLWVGSSNIEIRYHIPAGSNDAIAILSEDTSGATSQTEVLLDQFSLSYVSSVRYDREDHAVVDMILVPKSMYDEHV